MDIRTRFGLLLVFAATLGVTPAAAQAPAGVTPAAVAQGTAFPLEGQLLRVPRGECPGRGRPEPDRRRVDPQRWLVRRHRQAGHVRRAEGGVEERDPDAGQGGSSITDDEVKAVAAYVYSLSHKTGRASPASSRARWLSLDLTRIGRTTRAPFSLASTDDRQPSRRRFVSVSQVRRPSAHSLVSLG